MLLLHYRLSLDHDFTLWNNKLRVSILDTDINLSQRDVNK